MGAGLLIGLVVAAPAQAGGAGFVARAIVEGVAAAIVDSAGAPPRFDAPVAYQAVPLPYVPAAAVRYNRPCSVSDGFRTVAIPCDSAAALTTGVTYAPLYASAAPPVADYSTYGEPAVFRHRFHGYRHHVHAYHAHLRRLY